MVDVVVPVLDEEEALVRNAPYYSEFSKKARLIFVDGGSRDRTVEVAKNYGEVVNSAKGRALQKNCGANTANSDYILILHVDSKIDLSALEHIEKVLSAGACGGCFTITIDDKAPIFRLFEYLLNARAKFFKILDGDLGQFVRKDTFFKLRGYDKTPIMEDILFSRKLKEAGKVEILPYTIKVSSRKWHSNGFSKTFYQYFLGYLKLWSGRITPSNVGATETIRR